MPLPPEALPTAIPSSDRLGHPTRPRDWPHATRARGTQPQDWTPLRSITLGGPGALPTEWPLHLTGEDAQDHEPHWGRRRVEPPHWGRRRTMTIVTVVHIVGLRKQTCVFEKPVFKAPLRKWCAQLPQDAPGAPLRKWCPKCPSGCPPPPSRRYPQGARGWFYGLPYLFLCY